MRRKSLRIVGGVLGGRRFGAPASERTRATSERVREAVASALEARNAIADAWVLDLFSGTGALAFEALSRGAQGAVLVERDRKAVAGIRRSVQRLDLADRASVLPLDLARAPDDVAAQIARRAPPNAFTLVFADPPYADVDRVPSLVDALARGGQLSPDALVVLEHATRRPPRELGLLAPVSEYSYGDTSAVLAMLGREG